MSATLMDRVDDLALVAQWTQELTDEDGVIPEWLAELCADASQDFETKALRVAHRIEQEEAEIFALSEIVKRREAKLAARKNKVARLKQYATVCLELAGCEKVSDNELTVALQLNPPALKGDIPTEDVRNLAQIDASLVKHTPEVWALDKRAVLARMKAGDAPDLVTRYCTVERSRSLRIK